MCKFVGSQNDFEFFKFSSKNDKVKVEMCCIRFDVSSRWLKTKGRFKFIFSDMAFYVQRPIGLAIKASGIWVNGNGDQGSDPGGGQNFDFSDFVSFEVLEHSGVYRHTFEMIFYHPDGFVGERWAINREVSGSILSPKSAV